ncbi:pesticin C-terminus-like muramidase [Pseudoalteromonas luteoviolacea]|uniref:Pesticin C-terminal domain-containing protein n=1 Tax=Pseudoalteromonas luteoviolacea S4054 TaxID=1129367 RepID=A0A0F6AF57_9GAMM|nr:pesticin C-terminus-like muramidase [Pseudoalteromonas luteoviolacea]AOT10067.1 hypothetical protein S4054249_20610 [Pseudoalteromonas luteoviolacea]AOT14978.1 hypothetical protein S40542_20575 [Pseudoalteromonas luteoviolacea]AOT19895.1 hypothetical protein S4054_20585 [Pseudoalteromonas luteoviolacea]KKE84842.1 hypothetical protein N479_07025 [Pseudoalteromonas luteoviolacea S4054]KZN72459.1 hypothetical protein N481_14615 [Pseudoalteromonas luteoviolacea S4047-1]
MFQFNTINRRKAAKHICLYEGVIAHLYVDTRGNVTLGAGFHITDAKALSKLALREKATHKAASRAVKIQEFETIARLPAGQLASWYESHCKLYLPQQECVKLLEKKVAEFEGELCRLFSPKNGYIPFHRMPPNVQLALLDMAYNLGTPNLSRAWPNLLHAIRTENWPQAAKECHRKHVSKARNNATERLFKQSGSTSILQRFGHFILAKALSQFKR